MIVRIKVLKRMHAIGYASFLLEMKQTFTIIAEPDHFVLLVRGLSRIRREKLLSAVAHDDEVECTID